jgi:hypothetical protein
MGNAQLAPDSAAAPPKSGDLDDLVELLRRRPLPDGVVSTVRRLIEDVDDGSEAADLLLLLRDGRRSTALRRMLGEGPWSLVGIRPAAGETAARAASRMRDSLRAYRRTGGVVEVDGTAWLLAQDCDELALRRDVAALVRAVGTVTAVVTPVSDLATITSARTAVSDLLSIAERRGWSGIIDPQRAQAAWRLSLIADLGEQQPVLLDGPVRTLAAIEGEGGPLLTTLHAWFALNGDTAAVAAELQLHCNTVRYRLRRAQELTGLDLSDPDQRLLTHLQLRLQRL